MSTKTTYQRLNQGAARLMFILGLGMAAVILGSVLSVGLSMRLAPRLQGLPLPLLSVLDLLIRHLWCLAILPALVYAAARVVELRVWSTAAGTLLIGSSFLLMLAYLQRGGGEVWRSTWDFLSWVVVMAVSTLWIRRAVLKGAQHRDAQAQRARAKAAAKVSEYDAFRAQAEALGDRHAAREVQGTLAATGTDGAPMPDAPAPAELADVSAYPQDGGGPDASAPLPAPASPADHEAASSDVASLDAASQDERSPDADGASSAAPEAASQEAASQDERSPDAEGGSAAAPNLTVAPGGDASSPSGEGTGRDDGGEPPAAAGAPDRH
ncbi:MAG TPA: hypothetical protein VK013_16985 [Myxococcaceae bacterium]|nr:hypothetical protein [Myxococcaceae bacterium]